MCHLKVRVNREGLKLNGTHQIQVYVDDAYILGGSVHTWRKNTEDLVVASKEIDLQVKSDKTKYMAMFQEQNAGKCHNIKNDKRSL